MVVPKLDILVIDGEIIEIRYEEEPGVTRWLSVGTDYEVYYQQRKTERCLSCKGLYAKSEIVARDGIRLCQSCDFDSGYSIRDEDVPF